MKAKLMTEEQKKVHREKQQQMYSDFCDELRKVKLPWEVDTSFFCFIKSINALISLFYIALSSNPDYIRDLFYRIRSSIYRIVDEEKAKQLNTFHKMLDEAWTTGDKEFDEFRQWIRFYDWYWDYSDDGNVLRAGQAKLDKIEAKAKEKGGIYQTAWQHAKTRHYEEHNARMEQINQERNNASNI